MVKQQLNAKSTSVSSVHAIAPYPSKPSQSRPKTKKKKSWIRKGAVLVGF